MNTSIIDEVVDQLGTMPQHLQSQVLDFARKLVQKEVKGTPGQKLMREAIEQGC